LIVAKNKIEESSLDTKSGRADKKPGAQWGCGEKDFFVLNFLFLFVSRQKEREFCVKYLP